MKTSGVALSKVAKNPTARKAAVVAVGLGGAALVIKKQGEKQINDRINEVNSITPFASTVVKTSPDTLTITTSEPVKLVQDTCGLNLTLLNLDKPYPPQWDPVIAHDLPLVSQEEGKWVVKGDFGALDDAEVTGKVKFVLPYKMANDCWDQKTNLLKNPLGAATTLVSAAADGVKQVAAPITAPVTGFLSSIWDSIKSIFIYIVIAVIGYVFYQFSKKDNAQTIVLAPAGAPAAAQTAPAPAAPAPTTAV